MDDTVQEKRGRLDKYFYHFSLKTYVVVLTGIVLKRKFQTHNMFLLRKKITSYLLIEEFYQELHVCINHKRNAKNTG